MEQIKLSRIVNCTVAFFLGQLIITSVVWAGIISTKQEIAIGEDMVKQVEKNFKVLDDPFLQERVARIGSRIAGVCDRQGLPYTFKVLDVDEVNALAVPGGFIYVFKGLVDLMETDDELAGIIAHEVGHASKRHSMKQIEKNLGMTILMGIAFGDRGVPLQMAALSAISAGYGRNDERQADKLGYELSVKAGYNRYGMLVGLMKLGEMNPGYESSLFSSHPDTKDRIGLVNKYLQSDKVRITAKETAEGKYARVVDGGWSLPEFKVPYENNKPLYRAYLAAGNLQTIAESVDYSSDRYILDSDGVNISIYYDAQKVTTLTPEDAMAAHVDLEELAGRFLEALKAWKKEGNS